MNINFNDLRQFKELNVDGSTNTAGNMYLHDNKLYKVLKDRYFFVDEIKRNIHFLEEKNFNNMPHIFEDINIDNEFMGYVMEYIPNSITLKKFVNSNGLLEYNKKIEYIEKLYCLLRSLHSYDITLGDIHLDNILLNNNDIYMIDFDYMCFLGDEFKFQQKYIIIVNGKRLVMSSKYVDNIKMMLCSLSMLYGIDLENIIDKKDASLDLDKFCDTLCMLDNNEEIRNYINLLKSNSDIYFDQSSYFKSLKEVNLSKKI